jgi:hypothetical protein
MVLLREDRPALLHYGEWSVSHKDKAARVDDGIHAEQIRRNRNQLIGFSYAGGRRERLARPKRRPATQSTDRLQLPA